MKLTLLLIPLLFLSSCTIDWHDEKKLEIAKKNCTEGESRKECSVEQICLLPDNIYSIDPDYDTDLYQKDVKIGSLVFYFKHMSGSIAPKIGYALPFYLYDCLERKEKEVVSQNTMQKVLEVLPKRGELYWPYIYGSPIDYSFFGNTLKFYYANGTEEGGVFELYEVTVQTTEPYYIEIYGDNDSDGLEKTPNEKFSTGFYYNH